MMSRFLAVIRLFVSWTFGDLKVEREILQNKVFPALSIGLRLHLPGEAPRDHRTMQICFDEFALLL